MLLIHHTPTTLTPAPCYCTQKGNTQQSFIYFSSNESTILNDFTSTLPGYRSNVIWGLIYHFQTIITTSSPPWCLAIYIYIYNLISTMMLGNVYIYIYIYNLISTMMLGNIYIYIYNLISTMMLGNVYIYIYNLISTMMLGNVYIYIHNLISTMMLGNVYIYIYNLISTMMLDNVYIYIHIRYGNVYVLCIAWQHVSIFQHCFEKLCNFFICFYFLNLLMILLVMMWY